MNKKITPSTNCDCTDCEMVWVECCEQDRPICETYDTPDGADGYMTICHYAFGCGPAREEDMRREMGKAYREWEVSLDRLERELEDARQYGAL